VSETDIIDEIADTLPEIMRRLVNHPISSGEWELTVAQMRALRVIAEPMRPNRSVLAPPAHLDGKRRENAAITMGDLARRLGISLSAATGLVDRLVQRGLVARDSDPDDRRIVCLRLAPAGKRAQDAFQRQKKRRMQAAIRHLSADDLMLIANGLAVFRRALDAAAKEGE
jgi:DNA-binding MarR family transcriptional regulator